MTTARTGCYGKLPIFGDFLRYNAGSSLVRALDQWFQEGLLGCEQAWGRTWRTEFAATAPLRFLYVSTKGAGALAGVLVPGVDKAGRHYPFVVFRELEARAGAQGWRRVPIEYESFLDAAAALADGGWRELDPAGLYDAIAALGSAPMAPTRGLEDWLQETTVGDLLPRILRAEGENGPWVLLQNLADLAQPGSRPQYVLAHPGGRTALECAVWLSVYEELNGGQPMPSVVMWGGTAQSSADERAASATRILFDLAKPAYLLPMLRPDLQNRKLCHMAREGLRNADRIARARDRFGGLLTDATRPVRGFIDAFVAAARTR